MGRGQRGENTLFITAPEVALAERPDLSDLAVNSGTAGNWAGEDPAFLPRQPNSRPERVGRLVR
jgi:hypothetical protein